jgi:starch phosphorylase
MLQGLDHRALVIGFARRFAPYKRAHLLFQDTEKLAEILNHPERPLRIFFAGKAHPRDGHGQEILKRVVEMSRREPFIGKIFFLEGYDIELARYLVQGVDVWLNTPTRPLEASGTSGMKVAANGGLNLSILDGWWCEGHEAGDLNGWAIGKGRLFQSQELQDEMDGATLYQLLEENVLPLFHERDVNGIPQGWLTKMKRSLETVPRFFNTDRMLEDYESLAYKPLSENHFRLLAERYSPVRAHAARLGDLRRSFDSLAIREARVADLSSLKVGDGRRGQGRGPARRAARGSGPGGADPGAEHRRRHRAGADRAAARCRVGHGGRACLRRQPPHAPLGRIQLRNPGTRP